jgi:hypothetical protein
MTLSVDYIYKYTLELILKNQVGGLSSEQFERYWNGEQNAYQGDLLGRWQARSSSKTGTNTGLIENETILQKLANFMLPLSIDIIGGNVEKPSNFRYRLAFRINGVDCYKINHNQIATVNASVINPPNVLKNMFYFVEYGGNEGYYYILPHTLPSAGITTADLDYICQPPDVKWGFIYNDDEERIYNEGTSVHPLWLADDCREICKRVLTTIGVSFKDRDFENFGKSVQLTGN